MSNIAIVQGFVESYGYDSDLGYTSTVVICDAVEYEHEGRFAAALDLVDFKNEFAARTYADAVNMGLAV